MSSEGAFGDVFGGMILGDVFVMSSEMTLGMSLEGVCGGRSFESVCGCCFFSCDVFGDVLGMCLWLP